MKSLTIAGVFSLLFHVSFGQFTNDLKIEHQAVHFMGEGGYMYTKIANGSQYYLNFSAKITNTGTSTELARLRVQKASIGFNVLSNIISLEPNESAIFFIDGENFGSSLGYGGTFVFTALSDNTLENTEDDQLSFTYSIASADAPHMCADFFNYQASSITGYFTGDANNSVTQGVGLLFEHLGSHPFNVSHIEIGIANIPENEQNQFIGNTLHAKVWSLDNDGFTLLGESNPESITAQNFGNTIWLQAQNGCIETPINGVILVAVYFSQAAPVPISYSGKTLYQQAIVSYDNDYYWLSPMPDTDNIFTHAPVIRPFFTCPLGLFEDGSSFETLIYPNPASQGATISIDLQNFEEMSIFIQDISGKTIEKINLGHLTIGRNDVWLDLTNYSRGIYIINIQSNKEKITYKLVVE